MDEYGCFRHTREDAREVARALDERDSVVFCYSHDQMGAMLILLCESFLKLGTMPFGGQPEGRMYVGIFGRGCGHLSKEKGPAQSYIDEKLNLKGDDGEKFSEFYAWIIEERIK